MLVSWRAVTARRLARHGLVASFPDAASAVSAMVGAHAQVLSAAELAIGLRTERSTATTVQDALWRDRTLVKTFGPRGTVHLLPASELGEWSPRWRQAVVPAAHAGILVFGANRGTKVTYRAAPDFAPVPDADLALLRRYLHSYGPATPGDYARWLAIRIGRSQELFVRADRDHATTDRVDLVGDDAWVNAGDTLFGSESPPDLRLLPYFDPYVVGSWPREKLFPGRAWDRALARGQAGNYPVLLLAGVVTGIWHLKRHGRRATMTVEPFIDLSKRRLTALDAEAHRVGRIVGAAIELVIGEVPVGPHA